MDADIIFKHDKARIMPETSELNRLWCDNTKITNFKGFEPKVSIGDGLIKKLTFLRAPLIWAATRHTNMTSEPLVII